jgi:hypothetical protein
MARSIVRPRSIAAGISVIALATALVAVHPDVAQSAGAIAYAIVHCSSISPCTGGNNASTGPGVQGISKKGAGVLASSDFLDGVRSYTYNPSKTHTGRAAVSGTDASTDGGGGNVGVGGYSTNGNAVNGVSTNAVGVFGASTNSVGVVGFTSNPSATRVGRASILGADISGDGGTGNFGVLGSSSNGVGVQGQSTNNGGVIALSTNNSAIYAQSTTARAIDARNVSGDGLQAIQAVGGTSDASGFNFATFNGSLAAMFYVDNAGNAHLHGQIFTAGSCSSGCAKKQGNSVVSYTPRESVPTMEDVGVGQLVNGQAYVQLDPAFANVIDRQSNYMVIVTPEGPSRGLYVSNKSAAGFAVTENPGGRSTLAFDYRIVAKPYGVSAARLPMINATQMPNPGRALLAAAKPKH